ncbi:FAD-dependent oxidoreductase [Neptunomonas antarctica]|uniref:Pyruvate/2-oxoglutarate dehydrogenase complex, dihydrolipoamide dehydrogenase (E3) component n=1 Tax=Neptunomonas antarctica TaxID=619304 RepID=A0A1N7M5W3_9GAMM|nr:FAD-dependent oxidoreductase [Neptunomonas antarctica]SIS81413.1 Pyruvate/2-oxoglutarate dehydrogenase complex, dihydrolipoamide dehydrogenase (E3) component [Neptunomonas antarctica]
MKRLVVIFLILIVLLIVWQTGGFALLTLENLKSQQAALTSWRDLHPVGASVAFFFFYVLVTALSIPGAVIMTLAGGALFGLLWGGILISFASALGATLAMLASRYLISDWVRRRFASSIAPIDAGVEKDGSFFLFTLRLIPIFPFFMINLLMGLTRMPAKTFWWVSQLGMLAGTLVFVNAGTQLAKIDSLSGILTFEIFSAFALLGIFPFIARKIVEIVQARKVYDGWKKPKKFDTNLVVIGAGSGGLVSAYIAAAVKAKVTLIEKNQMGGDCLNTGCVPSKALIRSARQAYEMRQAEQFGIQAVEPQVDFPAVMARIKNVIQQIEPHDSIERYTSLGVDVIQGTASIVSPWEVSVTKENGEQHTLSAKSVIIATGARPRIPNIPGLDQVDYLTSDSLWELNELPKRFVVLGGGPIGCELSQAFARLGSEVSIVQRAPHLMPREDQEAQELVEQQFSEEGIVLHLSSTAKEVIVREGQAYLLVEQAGEVVELPFDKLLLALGREANTSGFGLETLGIEARKDGTLDCNGFMQTRFPNVYVCGDVTGPFQFTHVAAHQAWFAAVNALFSGVKRFKVDYRVIPWVTFTDPEVARVGLSESEAVAQNLAYEVTRYGLDDLDRAIADGDDHGFVKVLTVAGKDKILGVTIVGKHSAELLAEFVLAMKYGLGMNKLLGTIHTYPTFSEANKYAAGEWKRAHVSPKIMRWLERFHTWRRS